MNDLFDHPSSSLSTTYTAEHIEVLEGLEPVRRHPGMYIGGTDENAVHQLAAEILDNAMDEAVAGHASTIDVTLDIGNRLTIRDNGRGIPIEAHPKFPQQSALEVIFTTLHAGGKFSGKIYETSGGLHGVGSSVVNALSAKMTVKVVRDRTIWQQTYERGAPVSNVEKVGIAKNRRGTEVSFVPDSGIFEAISFSPRRLYQLCRSKAFLFKGVTIRWNCDLALLTVATDDTPANAVLHFPGGLSDSLRDDIHPHTPLLTDIWHGNVELPVSAKGIPTGKLEWAIGWLENGPGSMISFCNTVPTPYGGTHENGFRNAVFKGLKLWGEQRNIKRTSILITDDIISNMAARLSVFIRNPQFQGQTKDKLTTPEAARLVEIALKSRFDLWLASQPAQSDNLLSYFLEKADERLRRKGNREVARKSATRRLRLPGKLVDCTRENSSETELFLVEGDSAGGSAKQARNRETQAVLPLRGKILNVASATADKLKSNQELRDIVEALGCGSGNHFDRSHLRYGRIIIMTDADVDGAHIASLLMTFFYQELPELIRYGHVYLAQPPLYRLTRGGKTVYAMNNHERDSMLNREFKGHSKVEVSRFKGLGEMPAADLKKTTMDPTARSLLRLTNPIEILNETKERVEALMGRKPELRFNFIQKQAGYVQQLDI